MKQDKLYYVYMMTNKNNTVLYTGITNSLLRRSFEHKSKNNEDSFSAKYNINELIYFQVCQSPIEVISIEKKIKSWRRDWKVNLIEKENPGWKDLFNDIELDFDV
jgi:putative endonuclease